jgi:hypothetical protein
MFTLSFYASKRRLRRWQIPRAAMAIPGCGDGQFRVRRFHPPYGGLFLYANQPRKQRTLSLQTTHV